MKLQRYKHDLDVSYALGTTLTFELVKCHPEQVTRVFFSSSTEPSEGIERLTKLCEKSKISIERNDKAFHILTPKGNCFVIGEFRKHTSPLTESSHIVLVNPSDAGNLGTILRTAVGFGITDIAIIKPSVDFFDPKTVRASMGAIFHVNLESFDSFDEYCRRFPGNARYAFMLSASEPITDVSVREPFSLIFGNEATGLPAQFADSCTAVVIKHSSDIDSLNLPMAAGIALFEFTRKKWQSGGHKEPK